MSEPQDPNTPPLPGAPEPPPTAPTGDTPGGTPPTAPPPPPPAGGYAAPPPGYGPPPTPGDQPYSVGNALSYGWAKFQQNVGPLIIVTLAIVAVAIVLGIVRLLANVGTNAAINPETGRVENPGFFGAALFFVLLLGLIQQFVSWVIAAGITKGSLDIVEGRRLDLNTMFKGYDMGQVVVAALLIAIITTIGFALCILPGIIASFMLSFTNYFLIDQKLSAVDAIKASFNFVKERFGTLLLLMLALLGINIVGACLCGVGLLVTIPVSVIAEAYAYKKLRGQPVAA
ncbi:MAG: hypothetical protein QM655_14565 [Nocardioidaceae bacterium]